jgi:hypothetical protein
MPSRTAISVLLLAGVLTAALPASVIPAWAKPGCPFGLKLLPSMDRCEGIKTSKEIAAIGLQLESFTIGEPTPQRSFFGGEEFSLQVPPAPEGISSDPAVKVRAYAGPGSTYQMDPLRLERANKGWRRFVWGAGLIRNEGIRLDQVRATAMLKRDGTTNLWLPVKFSSVPTYTLVIASNGYLKLAKVRIVSAANGEVMKECSGSTPIEGELRCSWDARKQPAGFYRIVARPVDSAVKPLNVSLYHDPKWLRP